MNTFRDTLPPANLLSSPPTLAARFLEPAGLRWGRFSAPDGASLRWAHLPAANAAVNCVLVGGFSEFVEKYFETMRDLEQRDIAVWCLDWRGQGGSERETLLPSRPRARDFAQDARDLKGFIETVIPRETLPRILIAHSMGAAIGLLALHKNTRLVDAAAMSAPMLNLQTRGVSRSVARAVAWLGTAAGVGSTFIPGSGPWRFDEHLAPETSATSHDPERCLIERTWFDTQQRLRVDGPTFGWIDSAFSVCAQLNAPGFLESITTPVLIGSPQQESFVSPRAARAAAARLPVCRLVEFPESRHEIFLETDTTRDRWLAEIDAFIAAHIRPVQRPQRAAGCP